MSRKKQEKTETPIVSDSPVTYAVPGEVAIALNTGRSQFIDGLVKQVRSGHVLDQVQVIGMLELIRDWTDARYADDRRNEIAKANLDAARTSMCELQAHVSKLTRQTNDAMAAATRAAHRHGRGPLGPEDDLE